MLLLLRTNALLISNVEQRRRYWAPVYFDGNTWCAKLQHRDISIIRDNFEWLMEEADAECITMEAFKYVISLYEK